MSDMDPRRVEVVIFVTVTGKKSSCPARSRKRPADPVMGMPQEKKFNTQVQSREMRVNGKKIIWYCTFQHNLFFTKKQNLPE
jgi:hypothetical protein